MVVYERSQYKALTEFWEGGHLREMVARGGSTVVHNSV